MGHVRLTDARKNNIWDKAKEGFYSANSNYSGLLDNKLPDYCEDLLINHAYNDPRLVNLAKITYSLRDELEDAIDFSYYNPDAPTRTLFKKDRNNDCRKLKNSPYGHFMEMWPLQNEPEDFYKLKSLKIFTPKSHFFGGTLSNDYSFNGLNMEEESFLDSYANHSLDDLFSHNNFTDPEYQQKIKQKFTQLTNNPLPNTSEKLSFEQAITTDIFLKRPRTMPKSVANLNSWSHLPLFIDDPLVFTIFHNFIIGRLKMHHKFKIHSNTVRATLDACSTLRQLLKIQPAFEPFIDPEDLAKSNAKQTKVVKTTEQLQQELQDKGIDSSGLAQIAFNSQLEN